MPRKFMSGHKQRKRKQRIDTLIQSQAGSLDEFFGSKKQKESSNVVEDLENEEEREDMGNEEHENLEDNTDTGAKEPNECIDEGDHEDMDVEVQNEDIGENKTLLATNGLRNWRNLGQRLKNHEASNEHIASMSKWIESERRLKKNETIDQCVQDQIKKEKEH
ncbi:hypothetical protein RHGRI_032002 [Rhododendron griersonianum]|uniref:Uncharacterized protein n=1 Tax=Rhododendron griersonianum TaxID=479676 RepID=A0AAV6ICH9_9ERIC|nr:hypothetical protein RHGRI_032002 [Rhododendron griersonianum]